MEALRYIERGLEYQARKNWGRLIFIWSILFMSLAIMATLLQLPEIYTVSLEISFLIFLALYMANGIMKVIFLHYYKNSMISNKGKTYEVITSEEKAKNYNDDVLGFLTSKYGDETMKRLGISRQSIEDYIQKRRFRDRIEQESNGKIDLPTHALNLYDKDEHFASFLRAQRIQRSDLLHAARLVQNHSALNMENDRAWSKEVLHDLSDFELDALRIEQAHNVYFTSRVLMKLAVLDDDQKFDLLKNILPNTQRSRRKEIFISDIDQFQ